MKRNRKLLALAMSGALVAGPMAYTAAPAIAATSSSTAAPTAPSAAKDAVAKTTSSAANKDLLTTVDDAYTAMRDVRAARLAIFDGNTKLAGQMTQDALAKMQSAQKSEAKWGVPSKSGQKGMTYLPFDSSIALGEDFAVTPDNEKAVGKANGQMAKGDTKGAADTLKASNINVSVAAAMVPASQSVTQLQDAEKKIKSGNFYEANLALKKVEDGVVIDQWALNDVPQQAGHAHQTSSATPQKTSPAGTKSNG